ncbi:MAG TPA: DUF6600 domain-containing protein [Rhodanobacteraceae bacterium]|nr:DUF6600 domain-containing protein [Rhodanobacteraceae bacterium]
MDMQARFHRTRRIGLLLALVMPCVWTIPALAAADAGDPPDRVARVAYVAGEAGLLPDGADQWRSVDVNRPLTTGDRLSTGADARLELDLGDTAMRLAGNTDLGFLQMDDWQTRASLTHGMLQLNVRVLPDGEDYEIDTPQVAVVVDRPATLRVDLGEGDATVVSVREGSAVIYGSDGARQTLTAGQSYRFVDTSLADAVAMAPVEDDAFYRWCRQREQLYADSDSRQYVSAGTIGYQDLDRYGQWQAEADYGQVWFPDDVGPDWVPYRHGHWAWVAPWGWTWISDAPWGFAPFHYGRWSVFDGRWGWMPGPVGVPAVYAPALVAFVGGSGWQVSVGFGSVPIGWYPLGPGVVYNPWYHVSRRYYGRVNCDVRHHRHRHWKKHVDEAYNVWRKPERLTRVHFHGKYPPHGITVVSGKVMAEGRDVHKARLLHVDDPTLRRAPVRFHGVDVRPQTPRRAWLHEATVKRLPVKDFDRPVVARRQHPRVASGKARSMHTPWASPVRLLDRGHGATRVDRPHRPLRAKPVARPVVRPVVRREAASTHVAHKPVPSRIVRMRAMHKRSGSMNRHLPVVPHLQVDETARASVPTPVRRRPDMHLPTPPQLAPAPKRFPERSVRHVQTRSSRVSISPRPSAPKRFDPPPVRAMNETAHHARPYVARPVRRPVSRPVPKPAPRPAPVSHPVRFHAVSHPAPAVHRNSGNHRKYPVRFKSH